jgi:predicted GH43/DUF377 family glycosyl hydrolase
MKNLILILTIAFVYQFSFQAQTKWDIYANNPVVNESIDLKALSIYDPCVILDGNIYRMWYTRKIGGDLEKIGYMTSPDGISWTLIDTAVIAPSTDATRFDSKKVGQPSVIKDGDTYKMWYWGDGPNIGNIGYATSTDGKTWTKFDGSKTDKSVYDRTGDGAGALALVFPHVIKDGDTYKMWYGSASFTTEIIYNGIFYATSSDGINWTKVAGSLANGAVLVKGDAGNFDEKAVMYPAIVKVNGKYHMLYTGYYSNIASEYCVGYASSDDGINWTRTNGTDTKNSILASRGSCSVLFNNTTNQYQIWYNQANFNTVLYATSGSNTTSVASSFDNINLVYNQSLKTIIVNNLKSNSQISVYNITGQEVKRLVSSSNNQTISVEGLNAGVYILCLRENSDIRSYKFVIR